MTFNEEECVICQKGFSDQEPSTSVTRGVPNLLEWSKTRKDIALQNHLNAQLKKSPRGKVLVHSKCRGNYVDIKRKIQVKGSASSEPPPTPKRQKLRSSKAPFEWKKNCFFCNSKVVFDDRHPDRHKDSRAVQGKAESVNMIKEVRARCDARDDLHGKTVKKRLCAINDLVHAEAVYHSGCHVRFFDNDGRTRGPAEENNCGRNESTEKIRAFDSMCDWLDQQNELHTLEDLQNKMVEQSGTDVYGTKWIKKKLKEKYGDYVFFL